MKDSLLIKVVTFLMAYCVRKGRVLNITGTSGPDDIYMIRYILARNRFFCLYIHQFLRSDRDDMHDHPWNFASYLVRGQYAEFKWEPFKNDPSHGWVKKTLRTTTRNRLVFRKATDLHRVIVPKTLTEAEKDRAPLTLFLSGRRQRDWGFVHEGKWVFWKTYLGIKE